MLRLTLANLRARKLRLAFSALAVVLGVAFVAGSLVLTDTLRQTFSGLVTNIAADSAVSIRTASPLAGDAGDEGRPPVPVAVVGRVAAVKGVAAAEGYVAGYAALIGRDGVPLKSSGAPTFGQSWSTDRRLTAFRIVAGRAPVRPGEVVLDSGTAGKQHYRVGDRLGLVLRGGRHEQTLVGIARFGRQNSLAGASIVSFDAQTAVRELGVGGFSSVDVAAASGVSHSDLKRRLAGTLGPTYDVRTAAEAGQSITASFQSAVGLFSTFLLVFAGIALFVGSFIIANTFTVLVAQRVRELALLRALGASQRQVRSQVVTEAAAVGLVGGLLGLGLGVLLALALRALLAGFGIDLPHGGLVISARTVLVSLAVGLIVTVVAALVPARRASTVAPVAAMRAEGASLAEATLGRRAASGAVVLMAGAGALALGLSDRIGGATLPLVGVGALLIFLGVAFLGPVIAPPVVAVLAAPLPRVFGAVVGWGSRTACACHGGQRRRVRHSSSGWRWWPRSGRWPPPCRPAWSRSSPAACAPMW